MLFVVSMDAVSDSTETIMMKLVGIVALEFHSSKIRVWFSDGVKVFCWCHTISYGERGAT